MRAPFPQVTFVATGGMTTATLAEYRAAGARVVALGSALQDPDELTALGRYLEAGGDDGNGAT